MQVSTPGNAVDALLSCRHSFRKWCCCRRRHYTSLEGTSGAPFSPARNSHCQQWMHLQSKHSLANKARCKWEQPNTDLKHGLMAVAVPFWLEKKNQKLWLFKIDEISSHFHVNYSYLILKRCVAWDERSSVESFHGSPLRFCFLNFHFRIFFWSSRQ